MTTIALTDRPVSLPSTRINVLNAAARFWFVVAVAGQLLFAFATAAFYGLTALRGDHHLWSRFIAHGWVRGDGIGNTAIAMHLVSAVLLIVSGVVQLIPALRKRFPAVHRWNGRLYMLSAVAISTAGLYMLWGRRAAGDLSQYVGTSLNAVLIWLCVAMAWRSAVRRDFRAHRAWALRLYVVALAAWFLRVAFFLILSIFGRPVGFDPATSRGPLLTAMAFAQYVVPLAIVELYLRAQQHAGAFRRIAVAAVIFVVTVGMAVGIVAVSFAIWLPHVRAGFDTRTSIAQTLSQTIDARGIEPAIQQYRAILRTAFAARYNFEERELNSLGYDLLRAKRYAESIRIFQLNVEAYPRSSNVYDSLGEAYMKAGDTPNAIANYRRALALNPTSASATAALRKLTGR